jgi:hypothetical protein
MKQITLESLLRKRASMRKSWMVALCCAMAACSSGPTSPGASVPECTGPVTIAVSSGTSPTFNWTPTCRLFFVLVELGAEDLWGIISDSTNAIAPPVQYGVVPAGARQFDPATIPLQTGQTYDVTLARWTGPGGDDGTVIANQNFTP